MAQGPYNPGGKRMASAFSAFWPRKFPERLFLKQGPVLMRAAIA